MSSKRIPLVGADGGSDGYYDSPLRFPQAATGDTLIVAYMAAVAQQALPQGKTKLGILTCVEVKACKRSAPLMERYGREFGFEVVYKGETSIAQPDYTAECLSAQSAGVQVLASYSDPQAFSRLAASCARQNFRPTFAIPSQALGSQHAKDPNLQGAIYPSPVFPYVVNDTPATNEFHTVMKKYLPASEVTGQHALAWAAAKLMQRGGARLAEPPTNESLLEGLWSIKDDDLGGLTPSLTFSPDRPPARLACWFTLVIENNAVVAVDNGRRSCR